MPNQPDEGRAGILRWAVEGCLDWLRNGLGEPDEVRSATADYRQEQDRLADFIGERCVLAADAKMSRAAIRKQYAEWCEKNGDKYPVSAARLFEAIRRHGGRDARFREHGVLVRGFEGLGLCQA